MSSEVSFLGYKGGASVTSFYSGISFSSTYSVGVVSSGSSGSSYRTISSPFKNSSLAHALAIFALSSADSTSIDR